MPKITFRDFDEFADAIGGIVGRFVPTGRSETDWWLQVVPVGRIFTHLLQIGGATTFAGDGAPTCMTLGIPMCDPKRIRIDGNCLRQNSFVLVREQQPFTFYTPAETRWAGVVIPLNQELLEPEVLESLDSQMHDDRADSQVATNCAHLTRLRTLLSRMFAEEERVGFLTDAAARSAEEEVILTTLHALETSNRAKVIHRGRPKLARAQVISRVLQLMRASDGNPLNVIDLCRAAEVSERTLRNVFQEYFGVGPMRLLKLRQLREIRIALLAADSAHDTVASIAMRFGVWDFSLFARNYKALYDESPSVTLRKAPIHQQHLLGAAFSHHDVLADARREAANLQFHFIA